VGPTVRRAAVIGRLRLLVLLVAAIGCGAGEEVEICDDDRDGRPDVGCAGTEPNEDPAIPGGQVEGTFTLVDGLTEAPIAGVVFGWGGDLVTSGLAGEASFLLPDRSEFEVSGTATGHLPVRFSAIAWGDDLSMTRGAYDAAHFDALLAEHGGYDGTGGVITARVRGRSPVGNSTLMADAVVSVDVPFALAVVADSAADSGWTEGEATLLGEESTVWFLDVEPGPVEVTVLGPSGAARCRPFDAPGGVESPNFEALAGTILAASFVCEEAP